MLTRSKSTVPGDRGESPKLFPGMLEAVTDDQRVQYGMRKAKGLMFTILLLFRGKTHLFRGHLPATVPAD